METSSLVIVIVVSVALILVITYFWTRFVFSMKRQLWNQQQQISLLIKIANKLGVHPSETEIIEKKNYASDEFLDK